MDKADADGRSTGQGRSKRPSNEDIPESLGTRHDMRFEDLRERHRLMRHQLQMAQNERDEARKEAQQAQSSSRILWKKSEELKRERGDLQKKLEQRTRGVPRFEHENLAKRYDQVCAQMRHLQHEREQIEGRFQQEKQEMEVRFFQRQKLDKQEVEARFLEDLKSLKASLEDAEQDRDNLRYQLSELKRENERLAEQLACVGPNYDSTKREVARIIDQRDQLRSVVRELQREKQLLQDKLAEVGRSPGKSATPPDTPSDARITELQGESHALRAERDRLSETSAELRSKVEGAEGRVRELEMECQRFRQSLAERDVSPSRQLSGGRLGDMTALSRGSSEEMLMMKRHRSSQGSLGIRGKCSQGSTDEDFPLHSDSSCSDILAIDRERSHSFEAKKKLSSSTSNLSSALTGSSDLYERSSSHSRLTEVNTRLRAKLGRYEKSLEQLRRDNQNLSGQVSRLDQEKSDMQFQLHAKTKELESAQLELSKANSQSKSAKTQLQMMTKEKGVAMRDNAASYQQSIQRESQLRELQAEKEILEQQRDIANKERERVIGEAVALKKKLETIKTQRQRDAKDLSGMRHLKLKAVSEVTALRKSLEEAQASRKASEEELAKMQEAISRASLKLPVSRQKAVAKGGALSQDLQLLLDRLQSLDNERKVINKKLFGADGPDQSLSDTLHKIELLYQERDNLVVEIEALQHSSSKINEDRIFELKQKIEDIMVERDALSTQSRGLKREVSSLSSKLVNMEQERDKLSIDCERLELQVQQLKNTTSRLVEDHTKTLERVNELWKQKWPPAWDEAWEEKHLSVPLGQDGFAGFSVVGGRDQPQLPNPGAFIITTVNQGGPADGILKIGDILDSVNGVSLTNADHREAVRAVKESKGLLSIVLRRRRNAYPIQMGIVSAVNSVPHLEATAAAKMEQHEYSLYVTGRESPGFRYDFKSIYTVTEVSSSGPANQILEPGDRIIKVNSISITHEKPSAVKKLMKPHNKVLKVIIERPQKTDCTGQLPYDWPRHEKPSSSPPINARKSSWTHSRTSTPNHSKGSRTSTPNHSKDSRDSCYSDNETTQNSQGSPDLGPDVEHLPDSCKGATAARKRQKRGPTHYPQGSRDSYSSESYSQETQSFSQDSCKPTKLVSVVTRVKRDSDNLQAPAPQRPMSDGVVYGNFNERRIEYEDVLLSERTDSQFSQSESYLSETSYGDYGLSSSQSIDLTFHSQTMLSHNRLTVETMMPTQNEPSHSQHSDDDEGFGRFLARDDASRTTFRNRGSCDAINPNSNANNSGSQPCESQLSESQLSESQLSYPSLSTHSYGHRRHSSNGGGATKRKQLFRTRQKSKTMYASRSLTKLSSDNHNSRTNGSLVSTRGRSRSNLSLGHAPSMTSVIEEPRRSTSTSNVSDYHEHDPLADATYIRANFTYIPRNPKELGIKAGDVFHIHDEAPSERFRASFWVSRLSSNGTDEQIGAIPNSMRAQEYLEAQGECLDIPLYEEVEAYTGQRPVLIFGALADQVTTSLLEGFPTLFYPCPSDAVEGIARITEARLKREVSEGKIIDFQRSEVGFEVIRIEAINSKQTKGKHCLLIGTIQALQSLKSLAPPISILIKPMTEESITTFSPEQISPEHAREVYEEVTALEEQHLHEFSASLFLIYMETLMGQIEAIVKKEKRKQAWVPVTKET